MSYLVNGQLLSEDQYQYAFVLPSTPVKPLKASEAADCQYAFFTPKCYPRFVQAAIGTAGGDEDFLKEYLKYDDGRGFGNFVVWFFFWPFLATIAFLNDIVMLFGILPPAEADQYETEDLWWNLISLPQETTLWLGASVGDIAWFKDAYSTWAYREDSSPALLAILDFVVWSLIAGVGAAVWYAIYYAYITITALIILNSVATALSGV